MNRFFINAVVTGISAYILLLALLLAGLILNGLSWAEFSDWALKAALVDIVLLAGSLLVGGLMQLVAKK